MIDDTNMLTLSRCSIHHTNSLSTAIIRNESVQLIVNQIFKILFLGYYRFKKKRLILHNPNEKIKGNQIRWTSRRFQSTVYQSTDLDTFRLTIMDMSAQSIFCHFLRFMMFWSNSEYKFSFRYPLEIWDTQYDFPWLLI